MLPVKWMWLLLLLMGSLLYGQDPQQPVDYILGKEEKLEMDVHIWGEVKSPGEYRVAYNTNLMELISKAGGPTSFANLKKVRLARPLSAAQGSGGTSRVLIYDMNRYLKEPKATNPVPILQPGDVVVVVQNRWYQWRELVKVSHEVAIIASVYVWYLRAK